MRVIKSQRPIHLVLLSVLTVILASLTMFNSCSSYELPIQLDNQGIFIPPPTASIPTDSQGLTDVSILDRSIVVDLKYKTADNFTGKVIYPKHFPALLRPNTAARLAYANKLLKEQGFRIKVWDAYRPQYAQIALWEGSGKDPDYVANPYTNPSLHTHGVAVDLTMVHLNGTEARMPTKFDEFSKRAATDYFHTDPIVRRNLAILKGAMRKAGFQYIFTEWWHFVDHEYEKYGSIKSIY